MMGALCTRSACGASLSYCIPAIHRDTGEPYCYACARRINEACGEEVVQLPRRSKKQGRSAVSASPLIQEIVGAFAATQVNIKDLPSDDPRAQVGAVCEELFTAGVDMLRSIIPNDRVRAIARVIWDLVGRKHVLVALGPDVPTLSFTAMRFDGEVKGLILMPKKWPQMVDDEPFMQLGAILFVGVQAVDFDNDQLIGNADAPMRCRAYEAELLRTLTQMPDFRPNSYQRQVMAEYPSGLDSPGLVLYPYRSYESKGDA